MRSVEQDGRRARHCPSPSVTRTTSLKTCSTNVRRRSGRHRRPPASPISARLNAAPSIKGPLRRPSPTPAGEKPTPQRGDELPVCRTPKCETASPAKPAEDQRPRTTSVKAEDGRTNLTPTANFPVGDTSLSPGLVRSTTPGRGPPSIDLSCKDCFQYAHSTEPIVPIRRLRRNDKSYTSPESAKDRRGHPLSKAALSWPASH